jgi:ribosomal protein L25 (general stress protein Ctc)
MAWIFVDFAQIINFKGSDMIWPLRIALPLTIVLGLIRNANIKKELRHAQKKLEVIYGHLASNVLFCLNDLQIKPLYRSEEIDINTIWPDPTSYQKIFITAFTKDVYKAPSSEKFESPL